LKELVDEGDFTVVIATHSTAFLGGLSESEKATVAFMKSGEAQVVFEPISPIYKKILPVFGAHPLSNIFNEAPILLVEGEDDERIWQQAVRSATGAIKLYPVVCGSVDEMQGYEEETKKIVLSVYDRSKAYSLRDRDKYPEDIEDLPPVTRMRLSCRAAENLMLCDDVLQSVNLTWEQVKERIGAWLPANGSHPRYEFLKKFVDDGFDRKMADLKELRNLLLVILDTTKPWEVLVGQVIARQRKPASDAVISEDSIVAYLGKKATENLLPA